MANLMLGYQRPYFWTFECFTQMVKRKCKKFEMLSSILTFILYLFLQEQDYANLTFKCKYLTFYKIKHLTLYTFFSKFFAVTSANMDVCALKNKGVLKGFIH